VAILDYQQFCYFRKSRLDQKIYENREFLSKSGRGDIQREFWEILSKIATQKDSTVRFAAGAGPSVKTGNTKGLPMAIILEPSRELAQQTEQCIEDFSQYIPSPSVSSVCLVGGGDSRYQKQLIEEGVDIVVGTPGRLEDFINSGVLKLDNVRFLIVDECDALLAQNQNRLIENIHRKCPQISPEGRRLQMVVCSATLHNFNVKKLAQKLMSFPTWVDLKGEGDYLFIKCVKI
jgi:ATP-dependent RNA helicase DDX1